MSRKGLSLASLRRLRRQWEVRDQMLTLKELKAMGECFGHSGDYATADKLRTAQRIQKELTTRIAHRLRDFMFLPYKMMANAAVRDIYDKYATAYNTHEEFHSLDSMERVNQYWLALAQTFESHQNVTRLLGHGRRQLVQLDPELAPKIDAFFNRFFSARIGTHVLGAHFLHHWPAPKGAKKPAGVAMGVVQPTCPTAFVRDISNSFLSKSPGLYAPVELESAGDVSIEYVPGHLRVVLREVLSNAMRATAQTAQERGCDVQPVLVKVHRGQFGVFVTVSDRGGGITCPDRVWHWGHDPSEAQDPSGAGSSGDLDWTSPDSGEQSAQDRLFPLGFGLPVARLTVRYFGGDVRLQTLSGSGTSAYVHIPEIREGSIGADDISVVF